MATINVIKTSPGVPFKSAGRTFVLEQEIDFDNLTDSNGNSVVPNSGDTIQIIPVEAGTRVLLVETEIVNPADSATSATMTVGDGDDADGFDADVNLKAGAGTIVSTNSGDAYSVSGKRYTADDTIDVVPTWDGATTVKGKIRVRAVCIKMV